MQNILMSVSSFFSENFALLLLGEEVRNEEG